VARELTFVSYGKAKDEGVGFCLSGLGFDGHHVPRDLLHAKDVTSNAHLVAGSDLSLAWNAGAIDVGSVHGAAVLNKVLAVFAGNDGVFSRRERVGWEFHVGEAAPTDDSFFAHLETEPTEGTRQCL
jgi:hypothetical protein